MHLDRLVNLLEIIAVVGRPVSVAEVQVASGLPKPTCYRLVQTLTELCLVEEAESEGRYIIGDRLIRIALLGKSDVDVRRVSAPLLRAAATTFNETVFLASVAVDANENPPGVVAVFGAPKLKAIFLSRHQLL